MGVTVSVKKREGALKLTASYTWSRLDGNVFLEEDNEYGDIARPQHLPVGPQPLRSPARGARLGGLPGQPLVLERHGLQLLLGRALQPEVPQPRDRPVRGLPGRAWAQSPGANINDPSDDRDLRLPDIQKLNLQMRANLLPVTGINLEVFADIINVLALRTTTAVYVEDGPLFGQPSARLDPFRIRLGARYRY